MPMDLPPQAFETLFELLEPEDRVALACCSKKVHQLCATVSSALWREVEVYVPADKAVDLAQWLKTKQSSVQQLSVAITEMADGYCAMFTVKRWLAELSASCASSHMTSLKLSALEAVDHEGWDAEEVPGTALVLPQLQELSLSSNRYCPLNIIPGFTQLTALTRLEILGNCHLAGALRLPPGLRHLAYPQEVGVGPFGWDCGLKAAAGLRSLHVHCLWVRCMEDWAEDHGFSDVAELHVRILGEMLPQLEELGIDLSGVAEAGRRLDLAGAVALRNLRRLRLAAMRPAHAGFLKGLSALTGLSLRKCQQLPGLPPNLSQLSALQELSVEHYDSVASLTALEPLGQLSSLSLKSCNLETVDLQELQRLTSLKVMDITHSKLPALALTGESLSMATRLTQLGLDVSQAAGLAATLPLLAGLTRLDLQMCGPTGGQVEEDELAAITGGPHAAPPQATDAAGTQSPGSSGYDNSSDDSRSDEDEEGYSERRHLRRQRLRLQRRRRCPHTRVLPSPRLFPKAATLLGQVVEAALHMPALRQMCVHCNKAAQGGLDWLYCSQQLLKVGKARKIELVFKTGS
ncbi:hypothetical protein N2152v2_001724 [Parachlorella kessleri]